MRARRSVPAALRGRVISAAEALAAGVTYRQLRGPSFRRVAHDAYVVAEDGGPHRGLAQRCRELAAVVPGAVFSHETAAELLDLPAPGSAMLHVSVPPRIVLPCRDGMIVHGHASAPDEWVEAEGVRVTGGARLLLDLACRLDRDARVALGDAILHRRMASLEDLAAMAERYPGRRGVARLREVLPLLDGRAASPPESHLRLLFRDALLPPPVPQLEVYSGGIFVARVDLGWERARVAVEYEGRQHADGRQFATDVSRYTALVTAGWRPLRFAADDLRRGRWLVVHRVREALRERGGNVGGGAYPGS